MMKKLTGKQNFILLAFVVALIAALILGFVCNRTAFFDTSFISIISAALVLYISFYLTQQLNDKRERTRHVEMIVLEIREIIHEEAFLQANDDEQKKKAKLLHRRVSNKIDILVKCLSDDDELQEEVQRLKKIFNAAREFYGNHVDDIEYLKKSDIDIMCHIEKMETCCDRILTSLY